MAVHRWQDIKYLNKTPEQIAAMEARIAAARARRERAKRLKARPAFQRISAGLKDALAFAKGDYSRARVIMVNPATGEQIRLPPGSRQPPPGWQPTAQQRRLAVNPRRKLASKRR